MSTKMNINQRIEEIIQCCSKFNRINEFCFLKRITLIEPKKNRENKLVPNLLKF